MSNFGAQTRGLVTDRACTRQKGARRSFCEKTTLRRPSLPGGLRWVRGWVEPTAWRWQPATAQPSRRLQELDGIHAGRRRVGTATAAADGYRHSALVESLFCLGNSFFGRCGVELNLIVIGTQRGVGADS